MTTNHSQNQCLTHWSRVTHICGSKIIIIDSDNGGHQAIIWTNAGILLIGPLGMNFSETLIEINTFLIEKMHLKMSSAKYRRFRLGLNGLTRSMRQYGVPLPKWGNGRIFFGNDEYISCWNKILKLTHCSIVTPCGDIDLGQHWPRKWLVAWRHQTITGTNVDQALVRSGDTHQSTS